MVERLFGNLHDCMALQRAHYSGETPSRWTREALLDSWAMQLRNAMHFVKGSNAQPTDIVAADFFSGERWRELRAGNETSGRPEMPDQGKLEQWIETQILHLRYELIHAAQDAKNWPLTAVTVQLGRDLQAFLDNVPREHVADDFAVRVQNALDSVR